MENIEKPEIEIAQLRRLIEVIKKRYDYDFSNYAMSSFRRRVQRFIELFRMENMEELIRKLELDKHFFKTFLSEITVNVTEMFRDPSFWVELRDEIVPSILMNKKEFRVWHAGCSSGEEILSMAILLDEMDVLDQVEIVATDIDYSILAKAQEATYNLRNMEDVNRKNYQRFLGKRSLEHYYTVQDGKAVMDKRLLRNVQFVEHNLVNGEKIGVFDLILCRNVMIYFNQTLQNEVLKLFHASLPRYGYLAIGSKESLIWCEYANKFIVVNNNEKIYKKIRD
ncbi:chemotaxis protein methyltransferase CheR [Thermonema lapsum]|uniref:Chemotaxis protein methyltransferase CheR n=1 Tax=Thermonema lapsum TaxID=28195 RepID=A0A846MQT8_9BACT|nr:protein-glutamate O-methyltransferase CheR [Thermonema lapsum]NIK73730.1 chemotaxis protein methyltransferase CheR [Thermonema lapsum]